MTTDERIRPATPEDIPAIFDLIKGLAEFEKLSHEVVATEALLREQLFGKDKKPAAEVLICEVRMGGDWVNAGFALFFTSFSTFLARPGIYLEDLYIKPDFRSLGLGRKMLAALARVAVSRGSGRLEWSVLDWNVRARKFYEGLGATSLTEWTVHRIAGPALEKLAES